ncbi:hypothetical protein TrLO_g239 [Triparma laevis f. longispina]|uniref:Uncharacterized protein n=1 Tax=Triparma laevis f. longispina TaxID=1714387 RepID=A0A9W7E0X4_9STRA|nr:hypothetical protein TrLO_g239 [Triparma laevis f. longispina]
MSKSVATKSNDGNDSRERNGKRGAGDEEDVNGEETVVEAAAEIMTTLTTENTAPAAAPAVVDAYMHTTEFRRHFVEFVHGETLVTLRSTTKGWKAVADVLIKDGVMSGEIMVHDGKDISWLDHDPREERRALITRVIFILNITKVENMKVGKFACNLALNLVVVEIPEGVEEIGHYAFTYCRSLTYRIFPDDVIVHWRRSFPCLH